MARSSESSSNTLLLWTVLVLGIWAAHRTYKRQNLTNPLVPQSQDNSSHESSNPSTSAAQSGAHGQARPSYEVIENTFDQIRDRSVPSNFSMKFRNIRPESAPTQELQFTFNPKAEPTTFARLLFFLSQQYGHEKNYVLDDHDCKHFAHELYEAALSQDIRAYFVTIEYADHDVGHAIAGFPTSDQGMVYVDFTPTSTREGFEPTKRLIWLEEGKHYLDIPLDQMWTGFENSFASFNEYHEKHRSIASSASSLQSRINDFQKLASAHQAQVQAFNAKVSALNSSGQRISRDDVLRIEEEKNALNHRAQELNALNEDLREDQQELLEDQEHIGLPTSKRVVKSFKLFPIYN